MTPNSEGHMASHIERRKFLATLGGAAAAWPLAARAEQPAMPVIAFINGASAVASAHYAAAFRNGLNVTGTVEGQNVTVEYHWLEGQYDRPPALMADLVRRWAIRCSRRGESMKPGYWSWAPIPIAACARCFWAEPRATS